MNPILLYTTTKCTDFNVLNICSVQFSCSAVFRNVNMILPYLGYWSIWSIARGCWREIACHWQAVVCSKWSHHRKGTNSPPSSLWLSQLNSVRTLCQPVCRSTQPSSLMACRQSALSQPMEFHKTVWYCIIEWNISSQQKYLRKFCEFEFM